MECRLFVGALSLIMDNGQVRGLVTLDLMDGEVKAFQCKSVILACEGYQGLWTSVSAGSGNAIALAIRAGIEAHCSVFFEGLVSIIVHPKSW